MGNECLPILLLVLPLSLGLLHCGGLDVVLGIAHACWGVSPGTGNSCPAAPSLQWQQQLPPCTAANLLSSALCLGVEWLAHPRL